MRQNQRVFIDAVSVDAGVLTTEPPMRVECSLSKVCAAAVHMAAKPKFVQNGLGNAMLVRTANVETDFSGANSLHRVGSVP